MKDVLESDLITELEAIQSSMNYGETDYYVSSIQNESCMSCDGDCMGECQYRCVGDCSGTCEGYNR